MSDYLIERSPYAAMAAVLIVPEPATLLVFVGLFLGLVLLGARFGWSLLSD